MSEGASGIFAVAVIDGRSRAREDRSGAIGTSSLSYRLYEFAHRTLSTLVSK